MDHLLTEARNPASTNLDELTPPELVRLMNAEDARVIPAVAGQAGAIARAVEVIADRLRAGGRLIYLGAGTSGRLGVLDAAECPPTFSSPPEQVLGLIAGGPAALTRAVEGAEDHPEFAERDLRAVGLGPGDVLVGIATSGRTPYVRSGVEYARRVGAFTIGLSCNPDSDLLPLVDLAITPVLGPEVLTGSTRLKAGTATKMVLNMLSTGTMVRLGKTYGNLMVDLRATNTKLEARTNRIVRQLTGLSAAQADELLRQCGGELKTALVAGLAGVSPEQARERLRGVGGQVRQALAGTTPPRREERSDLLLGIDGGGTGTVALLADRDGKVLGRGEAGASNVRVAERGAALGALDAAVSRAFAAAGVPRARVASAYLGLAGAGRDEDAQVVREWAAGAGLAAAVEVGPDAGLLLAAGTPELWGVAVVAGTGSIAWGQSPDGRQARAGGWGPLLGDEGSGYRLAVAGLQAVARAADQRGGPTRLRERFLAHLGLRDARELVPCVYGKLDRTALAALAPLVLEVAEAGDETADEIVEREARELALAVVTVARALTLDGKRLPLALAGGLLIGGAGYRQRLLRALEGAGVRADPMTLVEEPAEGAVRLAATRARRPLPPPRPR